MKGSPVIDDNTDDDDFELEDDEEDEDVVNVSPSTHFIEDESALHVIFIHGLKGGVLVDKNSGERVWLRLLSSLRKAPEICTKAEVCGVTFPDEKVHDLVSIGPFDDMMGGLVHLYGPFLRAAKKRWGSNFHAYTYDWRQDIVLCAAGFEHYLEKTILQYDPPRLLIIAHSMGGLVTWTLLSILVRKYSSKEGLTPIQKRLMELIKRSRFLFCGTPFNAISATIEDCTAGTHMISFFAPSKKVFTLPAAFQLMIGPRSDPVFAPLYDPEVWKRLRLSVFAEKKGMTPQVVQDCLKALPRMLNYADNLRSNVLIPDFTGTPFEGLVTAVLTSKSWVTKSKLPDDFFTYTEERGGNWTMDRWEKVIPEQGDQRVTYSNATSIPKGLKLSKVHLTKKDHSTLLNDQPVIFGAIKELLAV